MEEHLPKECNHYEFDTTCTCEQETKSNSPPVKNDRRLQCWEDLMKTRKKLHNFLGSHLNRGPGDLLMNASEEIKKVKEDKTILEYTKISSPPDKQRGCPSFWKVPEELIDKNNKEERSYCFVQMSREEKCEIPTVERVDVPTQVLHEKDVLPRNRNIYEIWKNMKYKRFQTERLENKIKLLEPHKPITEDLIVIGSAIQRTCGGVADDPKTHNKHQINRTISVDVSQTAKEALLVIGDIAMNSDLPNKFYQVYLAFEDYQTTSNELLMKSIEIDNNCEFTIRIYWKRTKDFRLFGDITSYKRQPSPFTFNKSEFRILPHQKVNFPFWFKTNRPGTYVETWEIVTVPKILHETSHLRVKLTGIAVVGNLEDRCQTILNSLNDNVRQNLIKETLSDIVHKVTTEKITPVVYVYDKAKLFESMNTFPFPSHKQPRYLYNEGVVQRLEEIYKTVRKPDDPETWSYSLQEIRNLILNYGKLNDVNKKNEMTDEAANNFMKYTELEEEFEKLVKQLKPFGMLPLNTDQSYYEEVYSILCSYFTKICDEVHSLESTFAINFKKVYPKNINFTRDTTDFIIDDSIDSMAVPGFAIVTKPIPNQRPPPECLKDIPQHEWMKRYRAYHGLPIDDPKVGASKKTKEKKGKTKKETKQPKIQKTENVRPDHFKDDVKIVEPVTVLRKVPSQTSAPSLALDDDELSSSIVARNLSKSMLEQYHLNLYIIFYRNLCTATCVIEEVLEGYKQIKSMTHAAVKRVHECQHWQNYKQFAQLKSLLPEITKNDGCNLNKTEYFQNPNLLINTDSKLSLRNALNTYSTKNKIKVEKLISYPQKTVMNSEVLREIVKNVSTSTIEGGILDPNWEDFKSIEAQTEVQSKSYENDIIPNIEYICDKTSVEELFLKKSEGCQKNEEEYVSDEEHFYNSFEENEQL